MQEPLGTTPQRTPEQEAQVRRRALPIAITAFIIGAAGLVILVKQSIDTVHLPPLLGVNLSFCAMLMGIGIFFYAKGTPRTGAAAILCLLSILMGIAGPLVFVKLAVDYRKATEQTELTNLSAIANAARDYAASNGGNYAPDLLTLLEQKKITPQNLHSPYEQTLAAGSVEKTLESKEYPARIDLVKAIDKLSDYQYFPGNLRLAAAALPSATAPAATQSAGELFSQIVVVTRFLPIERKELSIAFADGKADFVNLQEVERILAASNQARETLGFDPVRPPESVQKALEIERQNPGQ